MHGDGHRWETLTPPTFSAKWRACWRSGERQRRPDGHSRLAAARAPVSVPLEPGGESEVLFKMHCRENTLRLL